MPRGVIKAKRPKLSETQEIPHGNQEQWLTDEDDMDESMDQPDDLSEDGQDDFEDAVIARLDALGAQLKLLLGKFIHAPPN